MITYKYCYCIVALFVLGCSKPDKGHLPQTSGFGADVNYALLLRKDALLTQVSLTANASIIRPDQVEEQEIFNIPKLSYREGNKISLYTRQANCTGEVIRFDFNTNLKVTIPVFMDLAACEIDVISLAHSGDSVYLAYSYPGSELKEKHYFIRAVNLADGMESYREYELSGEPLQMVYSNSRMFVLSREGEKDDDEKDGDIQFAMMVLNPENGVEVHKFNLDKDAQKIFRTVEGHIMVTYPKLHLFIDSQTLGIISTVRYNEGKEPKFGVTEKAYFGPGGSLYYPMPTGLSGTIYETIPGVYDFANNTSVLYYYENFLTDAERNFEFEIGDTSLVAYDAANNLILIGYQKLGGNGKGGLLRIRPTPGLELVDNTDLDGIPYELFIPGL